MGIKRLPKKKKKEKGERKRTIRGCGNGFSLGTVWPGGGLGNHIATRYFRRATARPAKRKTNFVTFLGHVL